MKTFVGWFVILLPCFSLVGFIVNREFVPLEPEFRVDDPVRIVKGLYKGKEGTISSGFIRGVFVRHWHYMIDSDNYDTYWADDYELEKK